MKIERTIRPTARILGTASVVAALACAPPADRPSEVRSAAIGRVASSADGMVVSGSEPATRAGASVLAAGGNAVDAAVAAAFALAVAEPTQSGLGGRTQALVWQPDGTAFGVDATTEVPASYDPDTAEQVEDGYGVVAIPGTVAGLLRLHREAGSLPLTDLIAPAIALAEDGFALSEGEARRIAGIRGRLALSSAAASAFVRPDGTRYNPGDTLRQPVLAEVLRAIADGGEDVFYRGWIAERMAADVTAHGGYLTAEDLAGYEAESSIVVHGRFAGLDLVGTYIPASGATTIEALQILDRAGVAGMDAGTRAFAVGRALEMAYADRETAWNDDRPHAEDAAWIVSPELAEERAAALGGAISPASASTDGVGPRPESPNTTHLSVLDRDGMAVAMTQSLGPTGGSRVATEGLGFLYAATLGGYLGRVEPGDRPWSSQSPLIGMEDGRPAFVMGGAGARRIISALVHTVVRLEVEGLPLEEALAAPRLHPSGNTWSFEEKGGPEWRSPEGERANAAPAGAALAADAGHEVLVRPFGVYFARLNVIAVDRATGVATGVADPRWAWGAAAGPASAR